TKPFTFEGPRRKKAASEGLERLQSVVDTLIVIPNDRLSAVVEKKTSLAEAFLVADDVLRQGVQGISDIVVRPGLINVDFADVKAVMKDAGIALMGMGRGIGERRARQAAEMAANSPLLETTISGAKRMLVNITAGPDFTLGETHEAMEYIMQLADAEDAAIFMGQVIDPTLDSDEVTITLLAAGMDPHAQPKRNETVFEPEQEPRRRETAREPSQREGVSSRDRSLEPSARLEAKPIEIDEADFDIPTFLRKQRQQ
nr:cell division protein FtsZ [Hyphomonas sp.]